MRRDETKNGLLVNEMTLAEWRRYLSKESKDRNGMARRSREDAAFAGFSADEIEREYGAVPTGFEMKYEEAVDTRPASGFNRNFHQRKRGDLQAPRLPEPIAEKRA